ncbi:MAG: hypothetical protein DYH05_11055 [Acidobacteria bacterium ACB1]|nr:hypothetical protein [Acidobacteria bacterium ACB1]
MRSTNKRAHGSNDPATESCDLIAAAFTDLSMPLCLIILKPAPVVTAIVYETRGHKNQAAMLGHHDEA